MFGSLFSGNRSNRQNSNNQKISAAADHNILRTRTEQSAKTTNGGAVDAAVKNTTAAGSAAAAAAAASKMASHLTGSTQASVGGGGGSRLASLQNVETYRRFALISFIKKDPIASQFAQIMNVDDHLDELSSIYNITQILRDDCLKVMLMKQCVKMGATKIYDMIPPSTLVKSFINPQNISIEVTEDERLSMLATFEAGGGRKIKKPKNVYVKALTTMGMQVLQLSNLMPVLDELMLKNNKPKEKANSTSITEIDAEQTNSAAPDPEATSPKVPDLYQTRLNSPNTVVGSMNLVQAMRKEYSPPTSAEVQQSPRLEAATTKQSYSRDFDRPPSTMSTLSSIYSSMDKSTIDHVATDDVVPSHGAVMRTNSFTDDPAPTAAVESSPVETANHVATAPNPDENDYEHWRAEDYVYLDDSERASAAVQTANELVEMVAEESVTAAAPATWAAAPAANFENTFESSGAFDSDDRLSEENNDILSFEKLFQESMIDFNPDHRRQSRWDVEPGHRQQPTIAGGDNNDGSAVVQGRSKLHQSVPSAFAATAGGGGSDSSTELLMNLNNTNLLKTPKTPLVEQPYSVQNQQQSHQQQQGQHFKFSDVEASELQQPTDESNQSHVTENTQGTGAATTISSGRRKRKSLLFMADLARQEDSKSKLRQAAGKRRKRTMDLATNYENSRDIATGSGLLNKSQQQQQQSSMLASGIGNSMSTPTYLTGL